MSGMLLAVAVLLAGGIAALLAGRRSTLATTLGAGSALAAGVLGSAAAGRLLLAASGATFALPWLAPSGNPALAADTLSALFLLPAFAVPALAALHGAGSARVRRRPAPGLSWLAYDTLVAATVVVLLARSAPLLLVAWEVMALAAALLIGLEGDPGQRWRGSWLQLLTAQLGTAALAGFFLLAGQGSGLADFRGPLVGAGGAPAPGILFLLALAGFGAPAGLTPRAARSRSARVVPPGHVTAVLSAVTVATGFYGLLRAVTLLGAPGWWWGPTLLALGAALALRGARGARAGGDLTALPARVALGHAGVIVAAVGMGLLGVSAHSPVVAFLGFAAALVHMLNRALFQALLELASGAVRQATGTLAPDRLGGLYRRMRDTGSVMLVGALAGAALPPANGFAGVLLLYAAGLVAAVSLPPVAAGAAAAMLLAFTVALGLAAPALARAFAAAFLGRPRGDEAAGAREVASPLRVPMHLLAGACALLGFFPALALFAAARPAVALAAPAGSGLVGGIDAAGLVVRWAGRSALAVSALTVLALAASLRPRPGAR